MTAQTYELVKERYWCLDYARIITAYLVVFGHVLPLGNPVRTFIYGFHMPLFFIISGMLHKNNLSFVESVKKGFRTLIVPMLFFCVVGLVYYIAIGGIHRGG